MKFLRTFYIKKKLFFFVYFSYAAIASATIEQISAKLLEPQQEIVELELNVEESTEFINQLKRVGKCSGIGCSYVLNGVGVMGTLISSTFTVISVISTATGLVLLAFRELDGVPIYISMPMLYGGLISTFAGILLTSCNFFTYFCGDALREWLNNTQEELNNLDSNNI